jgi:hypothetical protein
MTRRRRIGAALIVLGAITLAFGLTASPVSADAPEQTGWWFELQTKTLPVPLPAPPVVPDGGIFVQQGPQGPTAYGALKYRTAAAASATLTLTAAPGSTTSLGAPLQACATSASWQRPTSAPGNWEDAPKYGNPCTPGRISSDGTVVAFAFNSAFIENGVLDVAIVPIDGSSPFAIAFDKPAANSLAVVPALQPPTTTPTTRPVATAPSAGESNVAAAAPAAPAAPTPTTSAPAAAGPSPIANNVLKLAGLGDPDRGARAAALGGASVIVVGWWLLSTQSVRVPRLLGGMGGAVAGGDDTAPEKTERMGGVARFARKRDRNSVALR